jgi:hypothetical protein
MDIPVTSSGDTNSNVDSASFLPLLAGKWKITGSENTKEYLQALGVNSFVARIVSNIPADVHIKIDSDGFRKISTTNGFFKQTVEQIFKFNKTGSFKNPLTRSVELMSIIPNPKMLMLQFHHEGEIFIPKAK